MADRVSIVGFGRFGGALGELLLESGVGVTAFDAQTPPPDSVRADSLEAAVKRADHVVIAVPVAQIRSTLEAMRPHLRPDQLVMDVGSVKIRPIEWMGEILGGDIPWIGTHPLFGPTSLARGERPLRAVVCPNPVHPEAVGRVRALFATIGVQSTELEAEAHDRLMADTHAMAFFIAKGLLDSGVDFASELAPPSFQAIARTVEAVRSDAGHLFGTIHLDNPFSEGARARLIESLESVHRTLDGLEAQSRSDQPPPSLQIPDLGDRSPELREARELIDDLDRELLRLLGRRAQLARRAKAAKKGIGEGVHDPSRETKLLEARRVAAVEEGLDPDSVTDVFQAILRFSRRLQSSEV